MNTKRSTLQRKRFIKDLRAFCKSNDYTSADDVAKEVELIRKKRSFKTSKMRNLTVHLSNLLKQDFIMFKNGKIILVEEKNHEVPEESAKEEPKPEPKPEPEPEPEEEPNPLDSLTEEEISKMKRTEIKSFVEKHDLDILIGNSSVGKLRDKLIDLKKSK